MEDDEETYWLKEALAKENISYQEILYFIPTQYLEECLIEKELLFQYLDDLNIAASINKNNAKDIAYYLTFNATDGVADELLIHLNNYKGFTNDNNSRERKS